MDRTNHTGDAFSAAMAAMNASQKRAVTTTEGPVLVVAGPGTGKTQILTLRIAHILQSTDTAPEQILALTFTESGAKAMRERLTRYIGVTAYRVPIHTFHGFAGRLIREYPDAYPEITNGRPLHEIERIAIIESILTSGETPTLAPVKAQTVHVRAIAGELGKLKQEYITPEELLRRIAVEEAELEGTERYHEKGAHKGKERSAYTKLARSIARNRELHHIYVRYEAILRESNRYDFADMLAHTVSALQHHEDMLRDLQESYQYVLADEHQDVNGAQNALIEELVSYHEYPNVFAVGDEKQAIYRFQGASLANFLYFEDRFSGTETITLTDSYRSGQRILDVAHSLIAVAPDSPLAPLRTELTAVSTDAGTVERRDFTHESVEEDWIADEVATLIAGGQPASEIAVIVRTNREVADLTRRLRTAGITVAPSSDSDILTHPITIHIREVLAAIAYPSEESHLTAVLHAPYLSIPPEDLVRCFADRARSETLSERITDANRLSAAGIADPTPITRVAALLNEMREASVVMTPPQVLATYLTKSGYLDHLMTTDPIAGTRVVRRLYDELSELTVAGQAQTITELVELLSRYDEHGIPLTAPYIETESEAVSVMTAHKSKGLEFETVFLPHLTDNRWGGSRSRSIFHIPLGYDVAQAHDKEDDDRRLLYVAMTRAKSTLHLTASATNAEGAALVPSRLLVSVDASAYTAVETGDVEAQFDPTAALRAAAPIRIPHERIAALVAARGFSATSFNNYVSSPWNYIYRNLLRIPELPTIPLRFGTVVHDVLERMTRAHRESGTLPSMTKVSEWIATALDRLPLTTTEVAGLNETALTSLTVYHEHLRTTLPQTTREEVSVSVPFATGVDALPEIPLTGKLDRIDFDDTGQATRVVDYKTGKPKTRNAIEGKTKSDDGGYKRQLVFYALLLELQDDERLRTRTCTLSFVEPHTNGSIREETFTITDEEIAALKKEISDAVSHLASKDVLATPCDERVCTYCHLVDALRAVD